jgi:nitrite reductase/ring-hydroxylating ferredoxin subunit
MISELAMPEVLVCNVGDIGEGGTRLVRVGRVEVGVIHYRGQYYAYRNLCPHQGGPACEGLKLPQIVEMIGEKGAHLGNKFDEDDLHIVCPWHGWEFHLSDGTHVIDKRQRLAKYEVAERDGQIYVTV